jgi:cell division septal protein FtsQ
MLRKQNLKEGEKRKKPLGKYWLAAGLFVVSAAGIFYLIIFSSLLALDKIRVEGNKEIKEEQIIEIAGPLLAKKIYNQIPVANPVFLPEEKIKSGILENLPEVKSVIVAKDFKSHSLIIKIEERQRSAIWCRVLVKEPNQVSSSTGQKTNQNESGFGPIEKCFFVDDQGFVFKPAPIFSGGPVATVYDETIQSIEIKDKVSSEKTLSFVLAAKKELGANNLDLTDFVIKSRSLGDLEILTSGSWRIYLNINNSVKDQIYSLKRVLEEEIKEKIGQLEYIDLRVENKVYYKLKNL